MTVHLVLMQHMCRITPTMCMCAAYLQLVHTGLSFLCAVCTLIHACAILLLSTHSTYNVVKIGAKHVLRICSMVAKMCTRVSRKSIFKFEIHSLMLTMFDYYLWEIRVDQF